MNTNRGIWEDEEAFLFQSEHDFSSQIKAFLPSLNTCFSWACQRGSKGTTSIIFLRSKTATAVSQSQTLSCTGISGNRILLPVSTLPNDLAHTTPSLQPLHLHPLTVDQPHHPTQSPAPPPTCFISLPLPCPPSLCPATARLATCHISCCKCSSANY